MALSTEPHDVVLDPAIRDWVLIPIMIVMVLIGVLRHYMTMLLTSAPKTNAKAIRETQALTRGRLLRAAANHIPFYAFDARRRFIGDQFEKGVYMKTPPPADASEDAGPPNPMGDPNQMDMMMDMMKKNMASMVPQMVIMGWVNFFFSGFVLIKLPFPLTVRFKTMLQRGIETAEMDVTWVSSLSWYFLNLFGLRGIFSLILGDSNAADGMKDMQQMAQPQPMAQPQDMLKIFKSEKESLDLVAHEWDLNDIEERLLAKWARSPAPVAVAKKKLQ